MRTSARWQEPTPRPAAQRRPRPSPVGSQASAAGPGLVVGNTGRGRRDRGRLSLLSWCSPLLGSPFPRLPSGARSSAGSLPGTWQLWHIGAWSLLSVSYRLGLKDQQEREIVHVLVDCCLQEKTYNPFYAFLAGRLCDHERRLQVSWVRGRLSPLPCAEHLLSSAHLRAPRARAVCRGPVTGPHHRSGSRVGHTVETSQPRDRGVTLWLHTSPSFADVLFRRLLRCRKRLRWRCRRRAVPDGRARGDAGSLPKPRSVWHVTNQCLGSARRWRSQRLVPMIGYV